MRTESESSLTIESPDLDAVAEALGVNRNTLPVTVSQLDESISDAPKFSASGYALTDSEWSIIEPHFPRGVVPRSKNDRGFLNGVLWRERMKGSGKSWWYIPKECGVPVATMRGRFGRWCEWGWWQALSEALHAEPGLSDRRKHDFKCIAMEAEQRRLKVVAGRE